MPAIFRSIAMLAVSLALIPPVLAGALSPSHSVAGSWKLIQVLDSVDMTSLDDEGAARLIGKVMTIQPGGARFDNYQCDRPSFESTQVEPNLYLQTEGGIDNSKLRLPNPATVVDLSCSTIILRDRNRAVITWRGYFFEARRVQQRKLRAF